jgi:hypothetical protein
MQGPEGPPMPGIGCYLEVVPQRKLVWTNALLPGFRPAPPVHEVGSYHGWGVALDQLVAWMGSPSGPGANS